MQVQQKKRKYILLSLLLMLASLACLCTSGITDLIESNVPDEVIIPDEVLPTPEISAPIEAPTDVPQDGDTTPGESTASAGDGLAVVDVNQYENDLGASVFVVLVENTGDVAQEFLEASVTLKDSNNNIVANETYFSNFNVLLPGMRGAITVSWFDGAPAWDSYEIFVQGDEVSEFSFYYTDIEVTSHELTKDDFDDDVIVGEIMNTGELATDGITVFAIAYDANGNLIGEDYWPVDVGILQPGESAEFSLPLFAFGGVPVEIADYEIDAQGYESTDDGG